MQLCKYKCFGMSHSWLYKDISIFFTGFKNKNLLLQEFCYDVSNVWGMFFIFRGKSPCCCRQCTVNRNMYIFVPVSYIKITTIRGATPMTVVDVVQSFAQENFVRHSGLQMNCIIFIYWNKDSTKCRQLTSIIYWSLIMRTLIYKRTLKHEQLVVRQDQEVGIN